MAVTQLDKGNSFGALHQGTRAFVIANAWDAGSARVLAGLGFAAIRPARPPRHRARARGRESTGGAGDRMRVAAIRHFLDLIDIPPPELSGIIEASRAMKKRVCGRAARPLDGRTLAMIFDKPSTRTRVSFDVAKDRDNV